MAAGAKAGRTEGKPAGSILLRSLLVRKSLLEFHRVTGLAARLLPATLPDRAVRFGAEDNPFCREALNETACERNCHQTQLTLLGRLERKLTPQQACCPAGMVHLAVPVVIQGRHVGTILGGRVRMQGAGDPGFQAASLLKRSRKSPPRLRQMQTALDSAPVFTPERIRAAARLLDVLARLFAEVLSPLPPVPLEKRSPRWRQAEEFVQSHLHEHLTTREAAHALNLSEACFCRMFHRLTGRTFHAYVAEARIEAAKAALQTSEQTVTEVALAVGFQSVSDFNRVFKARASLTPTEFRRRHAVR